ncbi:MAG: DNAase [Betaproteobacteria bacterium HGW-Betaproteobacteria-22]|nr:MAG: DNAase [Betaproteobacteria bacterium HGW-Betaproteobacteria-22]
MTLIDTHCHLDAAEFDVDRDEIATMSAAQGVSAIVIPAVAVGNFDAVIKLSQKYAHCTYALGIHPMYVDQANVNDITILSAYLEANTPVAVGEIGLDYFMTTPKLHPENTARQIYFFTEQLKLAQQYHLPVLLHVRNAIDDVLKHLRRHHVHGGIAHAFNGSFQQAQQFIDLGFKLGFGGAMTYSRARHIHELALKLPLASIVLETDAPDIPPQWIGNGGRNSPLELLKIAQFFADLRQLRLAEVLDITGLNAIKTIPKLADLCTSVNVLH